VTAHSPGDARAAPVPADGVRVLVVTHYYAEHGGGVERVAAELAERLSRRGFEITWAASADGATAPRIPPPDAPGGPRPPEPARWRRLPMGAWNVAERALGFPYPLWGPRSLWRLGREVRRSGVVHLHDSLYMGSLAAYLFARAAGRPVVVTQHIGFIPYSHAGLRLLLRLANRTLAAAVLRGADRTVFISHQVKDYFSRRLRPGGPAPLLVANGVEAALFHPLPAALRASARAELDWPADRPVLLFVGRFVEKKGLTVLRRLAASLPEPLWVFIGWGEQDPAAWRLPNVRTLAPMPHPELARAYQAADLLVLPSVGEGFPLVVQEAMACGTPALISRDTAAGWPEAASAVFTARPSVEEFAAALGRILADPAALAARRAEAAALARRLWSWDEACACYEALLRELAGSR
jgi:phosphatidylinositol alpha-1,6-mannosyltransferase